MSARKSSSIWDYFTIDPANCTVVVCKKQVSLTTS